jgi:hypothetical protein
VRRKRLLVAALLGVLLALPEVAGAQGPTRDSAVGDGSVSFVDFQFNITSGPSGENPTGTSIALVPALSSTPFTFSEVTCLAVAGNTATAVGRLAPNASGYTYAKFTVVDGGPTGDTYGAAGYRSAIAPPCTPITTFEGDISVLPEPLLTGEIQVIDAPPLPTATEQCKNGGWRSFGSVFKNQGDCVSFVATGGKNPPGKKP